jgi:hypothetical protein
MSNLAFVMNDAPTIRLSEMAHRYAAGSSRTVPRRIRALINVSDREILKGLTTHVGVDHLTVTLPSPLSEGEACSIFFGLSIADQLFSIIGSGKVIHCEASPHGDYRVEFSFSANDKKSRIALEQLFSTAPSNRIA